MTQLTTWKGFLIEETDARVGDGRPELVTRFWGRAERRARKLNALRVVPFYRYEIVRENGRWAVVAMQNVAGAVGPSRGGTS